MAELNAEPSDRRSGRFVPGRWLPAALVAVAVLVSFGIGWVSMSDWANDRAVEDLLELPPLVAPVASTSDAAGVRGDAEVLGVSVDGRHRAYVVATVETSCGGGASTRTLEPSVSEKTPRSSVGKA